MQVNEIINFIIVYQQYFSNLFHHSLTLSLFEMFC
jgi:hypothetical protein